MREYKKPPLGICPYAIWVDGLIQQHAQERFQELQRAIIDYVKEGLLVNQEWIDEYRQLQKVVKSSE